MIEWTSVEEVRNLMAHIKSAIKKAQKAAENRMRNKAVKSELRTIIKRTLANLTAENLQLASSKIDKAAAKGVIHKNTASRYKSRLAKKVNASKQA